ncbi:ABC transporter substrate-binding protein [Nocardia terpenica]|uniref:ABC transporter substrate-binding protein n=1 Tax=Nocardia terpenica TaxID=455432 RepID=A0A6G9Z521_9NOCA|nr:ABC transporter substrate-binding protein [Nocardia terpenica]
MPHIRNLPARGLDCVYVNFVSRTRTRAGVAAMLAATVLLAVPTGCGRSVTDAGTVAPAPATAAPTRYPLTIENCGHTLTFQRPPSRVVILNGASVAEVESFLTLGIGDRIIANSQSYGLSDDPAMAAEVAAVPTGGLRVGEGSEFTREQILALHPDLVVATWGGAFADRTGPISRDALAAAGIPAFVTPANCALGDPSASQAQRQATAKQSVESSFDLLLSLGRIFDVQQRAADYVNAQRARLADIEHRVGTRSRPNVLLVYPGMSAMNSNGLPAVFGGGIYDDVITRAGGRNPFGGRTSDELAQINAEALAAAPVDLVVIGRYRGDENADRMAADLFAKFPGWAASRAKRYISLSDSPYLGPLNAVAVGKIADALAAGS